MSVFVQDTYETPKTQVLNRNPPLPIPSVDKKPLKSWNDILSKKFLSYKINNLLSQKIKIFLSNILFIVSLIASVPLIITIFNVIQKEDSTGLVGWAFILGAIISFIWLLYGFFIIKNFIVVISSLLLIIVKSVLVYVTFKYSKK